MFYRKTAKYRVPVPECEIVVEPGQKKMEEDLKGFKPLFLVTQVIGLLAVILVAIMTAHYGGGFAWRSAPHLEFNWHPLLMTIGFIYLYGNSIMIYRVLRDFRKYKLKLIHASIHGIVLLCVIIGLVAVFDSHNLNVPPIANLYSLHSWIGLITVILFAFQWLVSILAFLYPGASMNIRGALMPYHVFFGLALFVMAIASAISGLNEKGYFLGNYSALPPAAVLMNVVGLSFILFAILVVYIVTDPKYKRYPRPEDGALLNNSPVD